MYLKPSQPRLLHATDIGGLFEFDSVLIAAGLAVGVGCVLAAAGRPVETSVEAVALPHRCVECRLGGLSGARGDEQEMVAVSNLRSWRIGLFHGWS